MMKRLGWIGVVLSLAAVLSLLAPWAGSGSVDRSSIELLATAGILDLVGDWQRDAAVAAWYLVLLLTAFALLALSWGRVCMSAAAILPLGPLMSVAATVVARSPLQLRWGAFVGLISGLAATGVAVLILAAETGRLEGLGE